MAAEPPATEAARRARAPRPGPRGRTVAPAARDAVAATLGDLPLRRDLLIEHLHALQDRHGALRPDHLVALADLLGLAPVEAFETATFYHHFDALPADGPPPPPVTIRVCEGLPCVLAGGEALLATLRATPPGAARILAAPCMGGCDTAPCCAAASGPAQAHLPSATSARVVAAFAQGVPLPPSAPPRRPPPFHRLAALREGHLNRDAMLAALDASGLRGMGGAGFPVARKWRAVMAAPAPRHLVVNADEGEPGTFKDRWILDREPWRFLEGMLLAAEAIDAEACWIYLRDEYPEARRLLVQALAALDADGVARRPIHLRRGAGAYVCGEETALLESLEGRRGYPRHKPPFPGERGLFGRPTLIHNVETLWWLPEVLAAPEAYAAAGRNGQAGERLFSLSGRVRRPGVYRAPIGITARDLIEDFGGGMPGDHRLAAYLPGGASGGILPASMADLPLGFGTLETHGCFVGSGAVIVLSDQDDLAEAARNLLRFFRDESCGQCTPCRVGTQKAVHLLDAPRWDRALLAELSQAMADGSICGLGQAAMNPVLSLLRHFPEEAAP
ncbi:NADH-ubiquinone oxidoreductase-F iron-sulfur binding region domain-containing protein [Roseomonas sp. HF4]|uniref:NADH-ubiquinone oxidoreductase-F iron-sulfur binding region domain-containing protein n=1 Tax=Roseomonas sp. HF4 TaxID=2562313 RepID=UPI0019808524|nr:NADH-ubiquinone oxidoreductase-F iron-sulfur binding region domain-containing protein [Roseomonas sp. HF4]